MVLINHRELFIQIIRDSSICSIFPLGTKSCVRGTIRKLQSIWRSDWTVGLKNWIKLFRILYGSVIEILMRNWWIWCVNARLLLNPFCRCRRKMTYPSWTNTKLIELLIRFRGRLNKIRHSPREPQRKKTRRPVRWDLNNIGKRLKEKLVIRNRKI